jgi:hypothetical protein
MHTRGLALIALLGTFAMACNADAHGFAGKRFFPATLAVDDPFVSDEAGLMLSRRKLPNGDGTATDTTDLAVDAAKTITSRFAISIGTDYLHLHPDGANSSNGYANAVVGGKYLAYLDEQGETLLSLGANVELGGTGSPGVGASSTSTLSPTIYFGKGFGDLPESMQYLRPLAFTATFAPNLDTRRFNTQSVSTGLSMQYDIHYLQSFVKDFGWQAPFDRLIPLVEFPLETCTSSGCAGQTTGTINPGFIWVGKHFQLGLEASVPLNHASGSQTGVIAQIHFFIDDLYPHSLGTPLFGK